MKRAFLAAALAGVYLLALGQVTLVDAAVGLAAGAALALPARGRLHARRIARFPLFAAAVIIAIARGSVIIARVVLGLQSWRKMGVVEVPIGARSPRGVEVAVFVMQLTPGTLVLDVDGERGVLVVHAIDASDPDGVRAEQERFYERWQRPVFP